MSNKLQQFFKRSAARTGLPFVKVDKMTDKLAGLEGMYEVSNMALEITAFEEIAEQLADCGITKTDEEIIAMAKEAVEHYLDDAVRAECWLSAIGFIVEKAGAAGD